MPNSGWTFLTGHGRVLAFIAKHPRATTREIAQEVRMTERAVQRITLDLETDGYIVRYRLGRGNRYEIHAELPMRHPLEKDYVVGDILLALGCDKEDVPEVKPA